jgi:FkbM family methyltransferase
MREWHCWHDFLKDRSVKIWGASNGGKLVLEKLTAKNVNVECFLDSDPCRWGNSFSNIKVCPPENICDGDILVIASMWQKDIFNTSLRGKDIFIVPYDDFQNDIYLFNHNFVLSNLDQIEDAYSIYKDKHSKEIFLSSVFFALSRDLANITYSTFEQYDHPMVSVSAGDCVIDGGAYNGDSAEAYLDRVDNDCVIHCFEPLIENTTTIATHLNQFIESKNVYVHQKSLGAKNAIVNLNIDRYSPQNNSVTTGAGDVSIQQVALDSFCCAESVIPNLIKFDLEGYDFKALRGAMRTIIRHRPKLQIAIYHRPDHFFSIPLYLASQLENYNFYLGNHGGGFWDTVLYGAPNESTKSDQCRQETSG